MPTTDPHAIVELRQYTLHPQQREVLIDLFDREFVETQEAQGMRVLGQFRDLDRPDQFVWLRGFADMPARHRALEGFYGGPVWAAHRHAANATMIDSDNVHLLRPAWPHCRPSAARAAAAWRAGCSRRRPAGHRVPIAGARHTPVAGPLPPPHGAHPAARRRAPARLVLHRAQPQHLCPPAGARRRTRAGGPGPVWRRGCVAVVCRQRRLGA